ncbi:MAG: hypothetical protein EAZ13_07770, partial [Sphingobacteriia bacterium]
TANAANKIYGQTLTGAAGSTAFTSVGLIGTETIGTVTLAYGTGAAANAAPGTYTGSVTPSAATGGTFTASNYNITYSTGNIIVGQLSNNADLSALTTTAGALSPVFASGTTAYTASVTNGTTSITVTPTRSAAIASITVNGVAVASGTASGNINLNIGNNTITVVVTAQDASTKTYTITVTRAASSNADLSTLTTTAGALSPVFASATTAYTASVSNGTTSITVTPTVSQANAAIQVQVNSGGYTTVSSGTASSALALNVGTNTITVVVTAQDATTKTYTVTVTRAAAAIVLSNNADLSTLTTTAGALSPVFASGTTAYTASVTNGTTSITVTPTRSEANASITVNGVAVASGTASGNINLSVGANTITVVVTAQDASTKTYTITVTRAAPTPVINLAGSLSPFNSCINGISSPQSFNVTGANLLGNITLTAPAGFELSTSANGVYTNSIVLVTVNGTVANTTLFIRLITSSVGTPSGNIVATSSGANNQAIAVSGIINALPIVAPITGIQQVCFQSTTPFASATTGGVWSSGNNTVATIDANGVITGRQSGTATINYTVTNASGCATTVTRDITVNVLPVLTVTANPTTVVKGLTTQLTANALGSIASYAWSPAANLSTPTQANTTARITDNTTFIVTATTAQGCIATASVLVAIKPDVIFVEPTNVFTPNGDGINDRFVIKNLDQYPNNKLQIFDRNGKVVYEQNNYANTWDGTVSGKILTKDTYFFVLTIKGQIVKRGTFTVLR